MTIYRKLMHTFTILAVLAIAAPSQAIETTARNAYVIDTITGTVMYEKGSEESLPPASMSKLMTIALVFKALKTGLITMDSTYRVSQRARAMGGSRMFVEFDTDVTIRDLLNGVIVQSGNDACVVLAEGLAGSEERFAAMMNEEAERIGLEHSTFANSSGWPDPQQRMSAKDLAKLAQHIQLEYPEYFPLFAQGDYTYNNINQPNRNPLIGTVDGADGFKTGHTEESGYGLVGSVTAQGRRIIFVIMGMNSEAERANEASRIAHWAISGFDSKTQFEAGDIITSAPTWLANRSEIALTTNKDVVTLIPVNGLDRPQISVEFDAPIKAPLEAGSEVGILKVQSTQTPGYEMPLITAEELRRGGFFSRYFDFMGEMVSQLGGALSGDDEEEAAANAGGENEGAEGEAEEDAEKAEAEAG